MKCVICLQEIKTDSNGWSGGHNAQPIAEGRCCGDCNSAIVVPTRIAAVYGVDFDSMFKRPEGNRVN